jgi:hypothetical protein
MICVSRGNMFTTYGSVDQSGQGAAAQRSSSSARAQDGAVRGGTEPVARVWAVTAPSLSISGASRRTGPARAGRGSLDSDHAEASAEHRAPVALVCSSKRPDARRDRFTGPESVSERATKAWLNDVQDVSRLKSISTIRLTVCVRRSSPKSMSCWCLHSSVWLARG